MQHAMQTMVPTTTSPAWWRSWLALLVSALFIPPLGAVLLWLRPWPEGAVRAVVGLTGRLALTCLLGILTMAYAVRLGIVHMEMAGAGWKPIFTLHNPQKDQDALEKDRAQHAAQPSTNLEREAPIALPADAAPAALAPQTSSAAAIESGGVGNGTVPRAGAYWTDFRGPKRDGVYTQTPILTAWPTGGLELLWRQPIGGGYASFVVAGSKAYTIEQRRGNETVAAYDLTTGRELWTNAWPALFSEAMGGDGPRATPTWDEGRLYALGAAGELRCLDAETGRVIWSKNILTDNAAQNLTWGMSAAPLVVDGKVIVLPGGRNGKSVVAYDKRTGERAWDALNDQQSYTSPMAVTLAGQRQLLAVSAERILGLRIEDGALLWDHPWVTMYGINSAQPIVIDSNHVFVSAGYDHGAALLEITSREGKFSVRPVWENRNLKSRFNSSVLHQDHIYGFDEGIFACLDARTGERKWKAGRYGYGQVLLAGGHLIVLTESGELVLLRATPERHEELSRFPAIEGKTWNHPAISDGILLVRNAREMAAFRLNR